MSLGCLLKSSTSLLQTVQKIKSQFSFLDWVREELCGYFQGGKHKDCTHPQQDRDQHDAASPGTTVDDPIPPPEPKQWDSPWQLQFYPSAAFQPLTFPGLRHPIRNVGTTAAQ